MVRKTTKTDRVIAQWLSAWALLTDAQRAAIVVFCFCDIDVAAAALKV